MNFPSRHTLLFLVPLCFVTLASTSLAIYLVLKLRSRGSEIELLEHEKNSMSSKILTLERGISSVPELDRDNLRPRTKLAQASRRIQELSGRGKEIDPSDRKRAEEGLRAAGDHLVTLLKGSPKPEFLRAAYHFNDFLTTSDPASLILFKVNVAHNSSKDIKDSFGVYSENYLALHPDSKMSFIVEALATYIEKDYEFMDNFEFVLDLKSFQSYLNHQDSFDQFSKFMDDYNESHPPGECDRFVFALYFLGTSAYRFDLAAHSLAGLSAIGLFPRGDANTLDLVWAPKKFRLVFSHRYDEMMKKQKDVSGMQFRDLLDTLKKCAQVDEKRKALLYKLLNEVPSLWELQSISNTLCLFKELSEDTIRVFSNFFEKVMNCTPKTDLKFPLESFKFIEFFLNIPADVQAYSEKVLNERSFLVCLLCRRWLTHINNHVDASTNTFKRERVMEEMASDFKNFNELCKYKYELSEIVEDCLEDQNL